MRGNTCLTIAIFLLNEATDCKWFRPYLDLVNSGIGRCAKCGHDSLVMLTGKGGPTLCKNCDSVRVKRHDDAFNLVKQNAKAGTGTLAI